MKRFSILIIVLSFIQLRTFAQCCSPGNPVGGTTNIGILDKNTLRLTSFYRYSNSSGYWAGSTKSDFNFVKNAKYNYVGAVVSYGLLNKLTIEAELGYYINKSQTYNVSPEFINKGFGFNNAVSSLKYNLISKSDKPFEWTVALGAKIPFSSKYQVVNNVELPRDVQPSTNAFGIVAQSFLYKGFPEKELRLFFINRYELNYPDVKKYKYGNALFNSFFIAKRINHSNWTAIAQVRYEFRGKDISNANCISCFASGSEINSSGGQLVFIAPQINYTIAKKWNISALADLPVYRYYNGTQLGNKYGVAFYLSHDIGGKCEVK